VNIVLLEPEIAPNVGNIARLCAATCSRLHLIEPFGFKWDDRQLKRAGMDYWNHVAWQKWSNWPAFRGSIPERSRVWLVEDGGGRRYTEVRYGSEDYLVFGRETAGIPRTLLELDPEHWIRIPMFHPEARSLNVGNCAALVMYEALRQGGFENEIARVT
jgi:tRNA (cytidine/uridine-2'-O-)-methyltransferase